MDTAQISGAGIAKRLASCNQPSRSKAVRLLLRWLPQQSAAAAAIDITKIWKGLFYCVWHADKLPFQLDLINRLSLLLETLDSDLAVKFFGSFLVTIRREWSGIDLLRLDKFYLLIRKFIHRLFGLLSKNGWDSDLVEIVVGVFSEKSLLATDKFEASGVNYHIAEVFLDEIEGYLPVRKETLDMLLRPFISVLEKSSNRVLVNKIKVNLFERLARSGVKFLNMERTENVEKFGKYALVLGFSEKFFKSASDEGTVQGNRKVLFGLHERFLKLEKDFEKSGLEISFENLGNGNEVERIDSLGTKIIHKNWEAEAKPQKKRKKEEKALDGVEKKSKVKKKKNASTYSATDGNGKLEDTVNGENSLENNDAETKSKRKKRKDLSDSSSENNGVIGDATVEQDAVNGDELGSVDMVNFDENVISDLQKQFERVAAEGGLPLPETPVPERKKRKRAKSAGKLSTVSNGETTEAKSGEKSGKKVRFSMKNNLVWKPQTPLPPQSLRLPPSATPRGSALKKGVAPGPIRETPPTAKKIKAKGSSVKKGRKSLKGVSPAVKKILKLQSFSA